MPPEEKPEHTAAPTNAMNENGKRSRSEQGDGERQNGGQQQQDEQGEQAGAASGTVSCSENHSESLSSSSASSPESLRKVARLDGHAAAVGTSSQQQQQQHQPQAIYPAASTTAQTTAAAPGVTTAAAPSPYQNHITTMQQYPSSAGAAAAASIVPIGPSTFVMQHQQRHPAQPARMHQHPNSMVTIGDTVAGPSSYAGAIVPQQQQQAQHAQQAQQQQATQKNVVNGTGGAEKMLRPFPYFYYRDFSHVPDPDPLSPLTAPGRVPNFPAKMHSILSRADLADVVSWNEHGRAWRVLKPREFEVKVIPTYFEHAKFSSFIRQANGWGFRRITQGKDRNSYYHEMFLRGLPHLCKMMKRPGVAEKQAADPDQEPDFYRISQEHPLPERAQDESILLQCTLQGGPKARMPIYFGALTTSLAGTHAKPGSAVQQPNHVTPPPSALLGNGTPHQTVHAAHAETNSYGHFMLPVPSSVNGGKVAVATHSAPGSAVYRHAPGQQQGSTEQGVTVIDPSLTMPANANPQFAAGFAAAQKQFQALFGHVLASRGPASSPHVASTQNNGGVIQPAPLAPGAPNPSQQQQHFAPLLPRPQHPPHNPHVVIHPVVHTQQQGQHYAGVGAQPYVQQISYHPVHVNATQTAEHSQQYQQQQHQDGQYYQPIPLTQGQATNLAPAPYDYGKNGQQQQQNDSDQQQQQQTYYVGTPQAAAQSSDHQHQAPAVAVQHS
eukprot:CAMPEP_0113452976 /NCGR_PEP_ID=MMETSP0014_2-20120614/7122_1 /TAXON_ID=2857 /ORGANISM="Nitzschia sp." /LENGTH=721 /DNA_ID=CAMNT_0000344361 /DNA_START=247 /DNA_END=2412 /DNA_ORIENTATION=- /assembly_acc=CAM_ASM_000159